MNSISTTQAGGTAAGSQARPAGPPPQRATMDAAAKLMGLEPSEMRQQLEGGASLADLATSAGVNIDELKSAMTDAIASSAPAGVVERMTAGLDSIIAGDRPPRPPCGGGPGRSGGGEQGGNDALAALASSLDLDLDSLLSSIEDGSFADLLDSSGHPDQARHDREPGALRPPTRRRKALRSAWSPMPIREGCSAPM